MAATAQHTLHVLGIRHHGPGSARSVRHALEALRPDVVLVEGPADAGGELIALAAHEAMRPPVAILTYAVDEPQRAVFHPFAVFSPEWQALQYALREKTPVRFMDLPLTNYLAIQREQTAQRAAGLSPRGPANAVNLSAPEDAPPQGAAGLSPRSPANAVNLSAPEDAPPQGAAGLSPRGPGNDENVSSPGDASKDQTTASPDAPVGSPAPPQPRESSLREDPLGHLARAAGYSDGEKWWEAIVEQSRPGVGNVSDVFAGVLEAMAALRTAVDADTEAAPSDSAVSVFPEAEKLREQRREAAMRQAIRAAQKEGFQRIAVVCGAWHAPVLDGCGVGGSTGSSRHSSCADVAGRHAERACYSAKGDAELLKGLPKVKVASTWVPWTYGRLASASGYGAGIDSPGWYEHLWTHPNEPTTHWLSRVAALLREADLDASPAQIIDSVRMVHSLTAIRNRYAPGLEEMNDACLAVLCHGNNAPLRLIHRRLIVSERLGEVPEETPTVPLQRDLQQQQKSLRLPATPEEKIYDFDLRKENDLARSRLLHRLSILGVSWGDVETARGRKGTFHEVWRVLWKPEFAVALIEASVWGNTVLDAAAARVRHDAAEAKELAPLTQLLSASLLADLPGAIDELMQSVQDMAAVTADVLQMMDAAEPLVRVARYSDVRGTSIGMVQEVVRGLIARICIGLPAACSSLDDEAAAQMAGRLTCVHQAIGLLEDAEQQGLWHGVLEQLADQEGLHGLLVGKSVRLLHEAGRWDAERLAQAMSLALSSAQAPADCAAWLEGFLSGSGLVLVHDPRLWEIVDAWVMQLAPERFTEVLPLLRRTFSTFSAPERRQMGQRARSHDGPAATVAASAGAAGIDLERANRVLPLLAKILGVRGGPNVAAAPPGGRAFR